MQHRPTPFPYFLSALLVLASLTATAFAASPTQPDRVQQTVWADGIDFSTSMSVESLRLVVGEPDGVVSHTQADDVRVSFGLFDDEGNPRPDGVYSYELHGLGGERSTLLRSGFFSIVAGSFVSPAERENQSFDKQLVAEDLYVDGSACVGLDCVDGEPLGLITTKLKNNNVRIMFQDTSSSGSFPSTDWMLLANEATNGGANLFSIVNCDESTDSCDSSGTDLSAPFTILGSAPANSLYVGNDGDVGFGTNSPVVDLHVLNSNTPTLRLDQDASSGFAAQAWDIGANEANFFVRDWTSGGQLPLRIRVGAPSNALYVDSEGDVGLGTDNPGARLDVDGDIVVSGTVDGRDVAADGDVLDGHVTDLDNPHQVTAEQVGAIGQAQLDAHTGDVSNPHQVTAQQVGAASDADLAAHTNNFSNPHNVTADLVGADPAGTASNVVSAALAAHEAAYDHAKIPSGLPVPVAEGGTGATDAASARANLGIADDAEKAGIVDVTEFSGNPATAAVVFSNAYGPGSQYSVSLTAMTGNDRKTYEPNLIARDESGFTITLGGQLGDLLEVHWQARPLAD